MLRAPRAPTRSEAWIAGVLAIAALQNVARAEVDTVAVGARLGADAFQTGTEGVDSYGLAIEPEGALSAHIRLRGAVSLDRLHFYDDLGSDFDGIAAHALVGVRFDLFRHDTLPIIAPFAASALGVGSIWESDRYPEAQSGPSHRFKPDLFFRFLELGLDVNPSRSYGVRFSVALEASTAIRLPSRELSAYLTRRF